MPRFHPTRLPSCSQRPRLAAGRFRGRCATTPPDRGSLDLATGDWRAQTRRHAVHGRRRSRGDQLAPAFAPNTSPTSTLAAQGSITAPACTGRATISWCSSAMPMPMIQRRQILQRLKECPPRSNTGARVPFHDPDPTAGRRNSVSARIPGGARSAPTGGHGWRITTARSAPAAWTVSKELCGHRAIAAPARPPLTTVGRVLKGRGLLKRAAHFSRSGSQKPEAHADQRSVLSELPESNAKHRVLRTDTPTFVPWSIAPQPPRCILLASAGHIDLCNITIPVRRAAGDAG